MTTTLMEQVFQFVFFYPLFMALFWVVGSLIFYFRRERRGERAPELAAYPSVTVLIPCHDEQVSIDAVVRAAAASDYPAFDILVVDDASTDRSREICIFRKQPPRQSALRPVGPVPITIRPVVQEIPGDIKQHRSERKQPRPGEIRATVDAP